MTTFLRAFSESELTAAQSFTRGSAGTGMTEVFDALATPVDGERIAMGIVCEGWITRARQLDLPKKGAKRDADREAYMQGALAAMCALGVVTIERANQIGFLVAVGRLEDFMNAKAAERAEETAEV